MIQVLQRAVRVLEILAEREPMTLAELTGETGLKKPTLCLILKTMVELGCAEKVESGVYATGPKLQELAALPRRRSTVRSLAEEAVARLADEVRESVVAAVVYNSTRYTIAQASFQQALMVNANVQAKGNFYTNATGRVLFAYMPDEEREAIIARNGMPTKETWGAAVTRAGMREALASIRDEKLTQMRTAGGAVVFLSVPVFGPDGEVWLALGISLPASRHVGDHRKQVVSGLRKAAAELSNHFRIRTNWSPDTAEQSTKTQ
jgi:IclR family acetate operon transcriptional repressor